MSNLSYIFLYLFVGLFIFTLIIKKNKSVGFVGAYSGFSFGMILYYIFIPILSIVFQKELSFRFGLVDSFIFSKSNISFIYSIFLIFVSFIIFNASYNFGYKKTLLEETKKFQIANKKKKDNNIFSFFAYITFFVGGLSFLILLYGLGGIGNALRIAEIKRSFSSSLSEFVDYRISLLVVPARIITVSPYLFFYLINNRKKNKDKVFFVISFVMTVLFFLFNAGRGPLLAFLLCFLYMFINKKIKRTWTFIIILGLFSMPALDLLDQLFNYFNTGQWGALKIDLFKYLYQFIHPFRNILNVQEIVDSFGFRKGSDLVTTFINLIPGVNFSLSYENTSFFYYGSLWTVLGGIPNDFITFGYIQMGILGVFLFTSLVGIIFGKVDSCLKGFKNGPDKDILKAALVLNCFFVVPSADIEPIIRSNFILTVLVLVIILSVKRKIRENSL